jgi:outer membrane immunogenic protein
MKRIVLASASLLVLSALAPASAADLAARPYTKAPVAVASIYNWSGFYIGGNAGGGSSHNCWDLTAVGVAAIPVTAEGCHNATGALVGGQIGYRWQSSSWVFGLEAQGDWADLKGSNVSAPAALFPLVNNTKIDAIGLFTGQVGYAWNNVLWYVKGGAAVAENHYSSFFTAPNIFAPVGTVFNQADETRWGGAVGTGVEFGFAPSWSVAVEYDHLFMGTNSVTFPASAIAVTRSDNIKQDVDMGTVRINYRFW